MWGLRIGLVFLAIVSPLPAWAAPLAPALHVEPMDGLNTFPEGSHLYENPHSSSRCGVAGVDSDLRDESAAYSYYRTVDGVSTSLPAGRCMDIRQIWVTWDAANVYLAIEGPNDLTTRGDLFIAIDTDTVKGPTVKLASPESKAVNFCEWDPEFFIAVDGPHTSGGYAALLDKSFAVIVDSNSGLSWNDGGFVASESAGMFYEFAIPFSALGLVPGIGGPVNIVAYTTYEDAGFDAFDSAPGCGQGGTGPREQIGDAPGDADHCYESDCFTGALDAGCGNPASDDSLGAGSAGTTPGSDDATGDVDTIEEYFEIDNFGAFPEGPSLVMGERFSYPDGNLTAQPDWVAHSAAGLNPVQVADSQVVLNQGAGSREDVHRSFPARAPGATTYARFDLTVVSASSLTVPGYFAHFSDGGTSNFRSRVFVAPPTSGGDFALALSVNSATPAVTWPSDFSFGQTYAIVHSFNSATGTAQLWVDPLGEGSINVTTTDAGMIGSKITAYCLRQSISHISTEVLDNLSTGSTFGSCELLDDAVTATEPSSGGNSGPVSVVVSGVGFQSGASVKLARSGQPDIPGSEVSVAADGYSLSVTFDLTGAAQGSWDIVVTNPDLSVLTLANGFTIESGAPYEIRASVLGPALLRPNRRKAFDIVLDNLGNNDVLEVPLWISRIPADASVELGFTLTFPPQAEGEPDWTTVPPTLDGLGGKYLALVIPRIPPGTSVRRLYLTVPNTVTSFELDASLTPPWADGETFRGCLAGAGVITSPSCMGSQLTAISAYLAATPEVQALSGIGLWAKVAWQCEGAASLPAALAKAEQVLDFMLQPVEGAAAPSGCEVALVPRWQDRRWVTIVTSVDPNEKLGLAGVGPSQLIGSEQLLPYSIRFENLESATAPAQEVVVIDPLDLAAFDPGTVTLGPITFGAHTLYPPPGSSSYATELDLRPNQNLIVRAGVSLDRATGIIAWSLRSIDPATGLLPEDPQVGFLPPNVTPPQGEGSVLFTAMPKRELAGGTAIRNRATIDFDGVSLLTAEWSNLLDATAPESEVDLPGGATTDSASFTVSWEASEPTPDLRDYSVYVSEDGDAYRPWRVHTTATADTITAPGGRTYAFYSLARDSSGNLEAVPEAPDAETYSRVAVEERAPLRLALEGAVPNPAVGGARVWFTLPSQERTVLEVLDVAGRRVMRREVGQLGPGRHVVDVSAAARRPGLYFLRLIQGGQTLRARMTVIRSFH